ncbi:MAG TPA: glucose 1-dehydrogenase [Vicinamibacterales bacterium]|jgi:2-keto-3-deoxy-L-fuconate dehydrogenase|nr:glucose 1-dehydrogenase [Vicinamibacterales bacterium]
MFDLSDRIALVTGAASGIGAAIAEAFAGAGARVFVTDLDATGAATTAQRIAEGGRRTEAMVLDVRDEVACREAAARVEESGSLDILVNNAGVGHVGTVVTTDGADLDRLYSVNVRGVFNVTKAFLPGMLTRKAGVIINMASIGGLVGIRDRIAYCVSKSAVVGLTKSMALDHALDGIRVNCICPGRVETPFVTARLREYPDPDRAYREMSASQAIGRMGRPDEIAAAALYLASDEAAFVTGCALAIDGGWSAGK